MERHVNQELRAPIDHVSSKFSYYSLFINFVIAKQVFHKYGVFSRRSTNGLNFRIIGINVNWFKTYSNFIAL